MYSEEARIEKVLELWAQDKTGSEIALEIGATRAAVMGLLFRLRQKGLTGYRKDHDAIMGGRPKGSGWKAPVYETPPQPPEVAPFKPRVYTKLPTQKIITDENPLTVFNLKSRHCRYPIGETPKGEHVFCGQTKKLGKSMCPEHNKLCYYPPKDYRTRNPDAKRPGLKKSFRFGTAV